MKKEEAREAWEVKNDPEGEKLEMYEIYREKGMEAEDAKAICEILARNPEAWVSVMMAEELGLIPSDDNPFKNALVTFFSFALFGIVPLIPFIVGYIAKMEEGLFYVSTIMTAVFLFILGVTKSMFSYAKWWKSGGETLVVGAAAAAASYLIGWAFEGI
jgi:VIT1/CCC1 family predicted Fe2+/Mn2+ transporter